MEIFRFLTLENEQNSRYDMAQVYFRNIVSYFMIVYVSVLQKETNLWMMSPATET